MPVIGVGHTGDRPRDPGDRLHDPGNRGAYPGFARVFACAARGQAHPEIASADSHIRPRMVESAMTTEQTTNIVSLSGKNAQRFVVTMGVVAAL